jgi:hypothetical protein
MHVVVKLSSPAQKSSLSSSRVLGFKRTTSGMKERCTVPEKRSTLPLPSGA